MFQFRTLFSKDVSRRLLEGLLICCYSYSGKAKRKRISSIYFPTILSWQSVPNMRF